MITITANGVTTNAPAPSSVEVTLNTQVKTAERNGNGQLIREILPDKWKLDMEWEFSNPSDFYAWFNVLKPLTRSNFTVNFPAPTGKIEQATMYISPISAKLLFYYGGATGRWKTLKCSFVEV